MNLENGRSGNSVSAASPMIKSAMERKKKEVEIVEIVYLFMWGIFSIYRVRFPNLRSYFRNNICFSLLRIILLWDKICFSLSRIIHYGYHGFLGPDPLFNWPRPTVQ